MTIGVRWGAATDAGRVRELNEDSLLAEPPLFAVADGVGGHAAGEVASGLAVAGLGRFAGSRAVESSSVLAAVRSANQAIRSHAADTPRPTGEAQRGMGSTVVGLALSWTDDADAVLVFNVGDSRAFRLSAGTLNQVSRDHSLVDELLRAGHITPEEAAVHPHRSVITRALGATDEVDVDSWRLEALVGDRYLLCSDGLTNEVAFADLQRVLTAVEDPQQAAGQLVALALEHGGRDNVTAVVVDVVGLEPWGEPAGIDATVASRLDRHPDADEPATAPLPDVDGAAQPVGTVAGPASEVGQRLGPAPEVRPVPGAEPTNPMPGAAGSAGLRPPGRPDDRPTNPGLTADAGAPRVQPPAVRPADPARRPLLRRRGR